jgi:Ser/Thr protein kinase RdoA (MazF antagonist)
MVAHDSLVTPPIGATVAEAEAIARSEFGLDGEATHLGGERDDNFRIDTVAGTFALQITNPAQDRAEIEMQQRCLTHIADVDADLPIPHPIAALDGELVATAAVRNTLCVVRVVTFLHGVGLESATATGQRNLGRLAARLDRAMLEFADPRLDREFMWDVARVGATRSLTQHLDDDQRDFVLPWFDHFDEHTDPRLRGLPRQAIHADLNQTNLVWDETESDQITGVFDFGDMVRSARIVEPTLAAAYQSMGQTDPVSVIARVISGYHEVSALSGAEIGLVPDLVMARFVQSLVIGAWRAELHPNNREYILSDSDGSWTALQQLHDIGTDQVRAVVHAACESGGIDD